MLLSKHFQYLGSLSKFPNLKHLMPFSISRPPIYSSNFTPTKTCGLLDFAYSSIPSFHNYSVYSMLRITVIIYHMNTHLRTKWINKLLLL